MNKILYLFQEYFSGSNAERYHFILKTRLDSFLRLDKNIAIKNKYYDDYSNRKFEHGTGSSNMEPEVLEPEFILVLQLARFLTTIDACTGTSDQKRKL